MNSSMTWILIQLIVILGLSIAQAGQAPAKKANEFDVAPQDAIAPVGVIQGLTDDELLETVQRQTFRYFWHYGHPKSGLARERSNTVKASFYWDYLNEAFGEPNLSQESFGSEACAIGGTGFGILATIVATERQWISREAALDRLILIADFLNKADSYHGIYPHFMDGETGKTIPFDRLDNGADIVETSYLMMGFLAAREYFKGPSLKEKYLVKRINQMWDVANWAWHASYRDSLLFWHWSPTNGFDMNFPIYGWNEALITYIMSASSKKHAISREVYEKGWTGSLGWKNGNTYYGYRLPLGFPEGGPLFFEQYTFMGIDPNGLFDDYGVDYLEQARNHTLINRAYCVANPKGYKGYSEKSWGLTAGDSVNGYDAHAPGESDRGVIQPTAALSSMPFTPQYSIEALRYFYEEMGDKLWTDYGFVDGFSEHFNWYAQSHLAIDQGPIVVMIENHRTGLIWRLFMRIPEIQNGLKRLGFSSPYYKARGHATSRPPLR